jgi:alkanesulfonate monooxygenase SsuD/methylene tetrahydromethanopterin reductase-like flavin-dependent oxidoreductase (luciferase family)
MVAEYGDYCNLLGHLTVKEIAELLNILRNHCKAVSRDYESVGKSYFVYVLLGESEKGLDQLFTRLADFRGLSSDEFRKRLPSNVFAGTPETVKTRFQELIDLGIDYFQIQFPYPEDYTQSNSFAHQVLKEFK